MRAAAALIVVATACRGPAEPAALEVRARTEPACSFAGWEHVAYTATAWRPGTLEVEVVDRWAFSDDLDTLMGPDEIRYLLSTIGRDELNSGEPIEVSWAFGREPPAGAGPGPNPCPSLERAHRDLVSAWEDPPMCTYEVAQLGRGGSSSNLFEPSCFADRGWRPTLLQRRLPVTAPHGRWIWLAAWVWAPPDAKVELRPDGDGWSYTVDGERGGRYPAWTLRARLVAPPRQTR